MIFRRTGILVIIVLAQFMCVSLWFAGNGVMVDLVRTFNLPGSSLGHLTSSVQFGFIGGTLFYSIYAFADRFSPSKVFFISSVLAAICNLGIIFSHGHFTFLLISRLFTGFFIAGIYPVGMKIASDYYDRDLGKALGFLLGALVLGTAFPHLLKTVLNTMPWEYVVISTSLLALMGGLLLFFMVPDGPYRRTGTRFKRLAIFKLFKEKNFRSAAFGYFGHMWELYAFWTFVPVILAGGFEPLSIQNGQISIATFLIIGIGSIACILGGFVSQKVGSFKVAYIALFCSGACCLFSPLILQFHHWSIFLFLLFWGMVVIMDSPQFSTLIAQSAPEENKASALTMVNCIGFSITIVSIQLLNVLKEDISYQWLFFFLLPGPLFGLLGMLEMNRKNSEFRN